MPPTHCFFSIKFKIIPAHNISSKISRDENRNTGLSANLYMVFFSSWLNTTDLSV